MRQLFLICVLVPNLCFASIDVRTMYIQAVEEFSTCGNAIMPWAGKSWKPDEKQQLLLESMGHLCDGMISLRNQNSAITGIVTASALFGERGDQKMTRLLRKR